ncbi:ATP-binding protein [Candidatus Woesearchaeota archaeon]|nr:ATP-binding protein [Candidatus Woesearchaeota archaeon]
MVVGQIIGGEFSRILLRQKSDKGIELGELLISEAKNSRILLQVYDLMYGSQISQQNLELIAGMKLEEETQLEMMDKELRNYTLVMLKPLIFIKNNRAMLCKSLPEFFSGVRDIQKNDLDFLEKPKNPLLIGKLRSGSKTLDVDIFLRGDDVFSHHILIPATTGKGKSNLTSCMLWSCQDKDYCGILVLDPHDEYYGRNSLGLKDHPAKNVAYYTPKNPPPGCKTLKINIKSLKPSHFNGVVNFSDPQRQALYSYYKKFGTSWINAILSESKLDVNFMEDTLNVVKRRIISLLDVDTAGGMSARGVFDFTAGESTIADICNELERGKTVIIDTSGFSGPVEILIGSMVSTEIFNRYKNYKLRGELERKPVISVILEEAPRVLGKEILEKGSNIFSTIAREGRKFKIGLTAITQLPSLIPREILANMNTKIILGIEMAPERQAIIDSAAQDLSNDNRNIASLDRGEAIVTSNFARFATPVKIPLFSDLVNETKSQEKKVRKEFLGIN